MIWIIEIIVKAFFASIFALLAATFTDRNWIIALSAGIGVIVSSLANHYFDEWNKERINPKFVIRTAHVKDENTLRITFELISGSLSSLSMQHPMDGRINQFLDNNPSGLAKVTAFAIGSTLVTSKGSDSHFVSEALDLLLENVHPGILLTFEITFEPGPIKTKTNHYQIYYIWEYKNVKYFESQTRLKKDDSLGKVQYGKLPSVSVIIAGKGYNLEEVKEHLRGFERAIMTRRPLN